MIFRQLFDSETSTYTYLLADSKTREAVIIDPVLEQIARDIRLLEELNLSLRYSLDTHPHADHITGSGELRARLGCQTVLGAASGVDCVNISAAHGQRLQFGKHALQVRSTPGHTNGCVTYVVVTQTQTLAFTGDTLMIRGCGRTDFQHGSAQQLYRSVHSQIFSLPPDTVIYPGHDYRGFTSSTVAEEMAHNPRLKTGITEACFIEIMSELNLPKPKRLHIAVPANMACGKQQPNTSKIPHINPTDVSDLSEYRIIDVRQSEEFNGELGHIAGAHLTPIDTLSRAAQSWHPNDKLLIVCRSGKRAQQACTILADLGFIDLNCLKGGMESWYNYQQQSDSNQRPATI